jgi:hypothetical protein
VVALSFVPQILRTAGKVGAEVRSIVCGSLMKIASGVTLSFVVVLNHDHGAVPHERVAGPA